MTEIKVEDKKKQTPLEKAKEKNQEKKDKKQMEFDQEERIQLRLQELDEMKASLVVTVNEMKNELEEEYNKLRLSLHEEINNEKESLVEAKSTLHSKRLELQEEKQELLDSYEAREKQMIKNIQEKEAVIQESYRIKLEQQWEEEYEEKLTMQNDLFEQQQNTLEAAEQEAKATIIEADKEAQDIRESAHQIVIEAEQKKIQILQDSRTTLEEKYADISKEFEEKLEAITEKEQLVKKRERKLMISEEDVEFMHEEYKKRERSLDEKSAKLSPRRILELEYDISRLEETESFHQAIITQLKEEIQSLKRLIPEDDLRSMSDIVDEAELLRKENSSLKDILSQTPSEKELLQLKSLPQKVDILEDDLSSERMLRIQAQSRAENLQIGVLELEQTKRVTETLKIINAQLQEEMDKINDVYKQNTQSKFPGLLAIDQQIQSKEYSNKPNVKVTLPELVKHIRDYGASNENLYYSKKMIRVFLASLAASKLIILQGLSGTGKSSLSRLFREAIDVKQSLIPVQPSWRDNRELLGYDNDFTRRFKETEFTKKLYEASAPENQQNTYFIVLDEMNLARIEYYFADFLAVMEEKPSDWKVNLVSSNEDNEESRPNYLVENGTSLFITQNIWFIGTANRDDSTFMITDKVYDRAQVINFVKREESFNAPKVNKLSLTFNQFNDLLVSPANDPQHQLTTNDRELIEMIDGQLQDDFGITFGNRIAMQLERFVATFSAAGGTKQEAIDYIIAHKVLRKLEVRYESTLVDKLKSLQETLEDFGGKGLFPECRSIIDKTINRLGE